MTNHLHFAHANGIPTAAYKPMLSSLSQHFMVSSIAVLGHDSNYPVTNNWVQLKHQLIDSVERQNREPVVGVGHSLGGALTLMAALERPDLFHSVIMLDVPVVNRLEACLIFAAKATGLIDKVTPAAKSKFRRTHWSSKEEALRYFRSRKLFAQFDERCLQAYVDSGLQPAQQGGFELTYQLDVELAVYRTIPHTLIVKRNRMKVPMAVIVGEQTDTVSKQQYHRMKNALGFYSKRTAGTHMFPLEFPDETAKQINRISQRLSQLQISRSASR